MASFIASILLCVPFVSGALGIVLGIAALNRIHHSGGRLGGRGLARAGILIGSASLVVQCGTLGMMTRWIEGRMHDALAAAVVQAVNAAEAGDSTALAAVWHDVEPAELAADRIAAFGEQAGARYGRLNRVEVVSERVSGSLFAQRIDAALTLHFEKGVYRGEASGRLLPDAAGFAPRIRLTEVTIQDAGQGDLTLAPVAEDVAAPPGGP